MDNRVHDRNSMFFWWNFRYLRQPESSNAEKVKFQNAKPSKSISEFWNSERLSGIQNLTMDADLILQAMARNSKVIIFSSCSPYSTPWGFSFLFFLSSWLGISLLGFGLNRTRKERYFFNGWKWVSWLKSAAEMGMTENGFERGFLFLRNDFVENVRTCWWWVLFWNVLW